MLKPEYKIGIEIEGIYSKDLRDYDMEYISDYWDLTHDASISTTDDYPYGYELVSKPLYPSEVESAVSAYWDFLSNYDISKGATNSCGTHIHVSFLTNELYDYFLNYKFYSLFKGMYLKNFKSDKYKKRLENYYCKDFDLSMQNSEKYFEEVTRRQSNATAKYNNDRYHALNYCKRIHGTMEIRLFPNITTEEGLDKILAFVTKTIEDYCPSDKAIKNNIANKKLKSSLLKKLYKELGYVDFYKNIKLLI